MKQQAYENLLIRIEDAWLNSVCSDNPLVVLDGHNTMKNLVAKSKILRAGGSTSASVMKEMTNVSR